MNLSVKRCLVGLVASATMFGIARAQDDESAGTVQLGQPVQSPASVPAEAQVQVPSQTGVPASMGQPIFSPPSMPGTAGVGPQGSPATPGYGNFYQLSRIDQVFNPRFFVNSYGGGLYGYGAGYSAIGAFVPYKLEDNALLFASAMGTVTYDGRGGSSIGGGWRYYSEIFDRVVGASVWFDLDNGHYQPYQQLGLSLESLGRYVDYRINGYIPISHPDHILSTDLTQTAALIGNGIGLLRNNVVEQAYGGFDAEIGGPTPILGRYGLNAYIGGYQLMGMGVVGGSTTGVSGRLLSQINEDLSFGVQVTNDHLFGLNTQFQVFVNLPNGKPGRWLRNPRVRDRLNQNVFRQYRVLAKTEEYQSYDTAINPGTHQPYFVENINPNLTTNGNGTAANPFNSIAAYEALPLASRERVDIILVQPRKDATTTNLDTGANGTLELFNGQSLLSTTIPHTFLTTNLPGVPLTLPGQTGSTDPMLFNSTGGNVITLAGGNTRGIQVSGFEIIGSATGSGIVGNNNTAVNINNNNINSGLNGVSLTSLFGTFATGTQAVFLDNTIQNNIGSGIQVTNNGSPPFMPPLEVQVQGNTITTNGGDGMKLVAEAGATIGGLIGGANVAATATTPAITNANTFNGNGLNGLDLIANGGTLNFNSPAVAATVATATTPATLATPAFGIFNNTFSANTLDGLAITSTNSSIANFIVQNNSFGVAGTASSGNLQYGLGLTADSGTTNILIGGLITTNPDNTTNDPGNTFNFNGVNAINFAVTGTALLNYNIENNTITNAASSTAAAPHDEFSFLYNGTSGLNGAAFDVENLSDPGVFITGVTWNLAGTPANFFDAPSATVGSGSPIVQPVSNTDVTTGLSAINGVNILAGSVPLSIQSNGLTAAASSLGLATTVIKNGEVSQLLPLTFTGNQFAPQSTLQGAVNLQQAGGSNPLTSASTAGSTLTVTFSNGLTATGAVQLDPAVSGVAVSALGEKFGSETPGFGSGMDGIHISASGTSVLNESVIQNNTITGYGNQGIHIETSNTASAANIVIQNNTIQSNGTGVNVNGTAVFSGGGVELDHNNASILNAVLAINTISANFNNGISLVDNGTGGSFNVVTHDNTVNGNGANGLNIATTGSSTLNYFSYRDTFGGNGLGSTKNVASTGGDNITISSSGTSVANITFENVLANAATGNGLSTTAGGASTLNLLIDSPADPLFTGTGSSFNQNGVDGLNLVSQGTALLHTSIYNTSLESNGQDGIEIQRNGASLTLTNIVDSTLNLNGRNGLYFQALGSDAVDPTQPLTGTPNKITLIGDSLNSNTLDGAQTNDFGQSVLVLSALSTTFDFNGQNGLNINLTPGAQFGYAIGNQPSELDNVSLSNNGANGIYITSNTSANPTGDAPSRTFLLIDSDQGNTVISNNGDAAAATDPDRGNGILAQYIGGDLGNGSAAQNVIVSGDTNPANPNFMTVIQSNKNDGIQFQIGAFANAMLTVENGVLIGGPENTERNGGNGINFQTVSQILVSDTSTGLANINDFNTAGIGTLNVFNSTITNNGLNGINLLGDALSQTNGSGGTTNSLNDAWGILNADIENSTITANLGNGVNIELEGRMGGDHSAFEEFPATANNLTFINNVISGNGNNGVFLEMNAGGQERNDGFGTALFREDQFFNGPTTPATVPLNPNNFDGQEWNTGRNANIVDNLLSDWMNLSTMQNTNLIMYGNAIQFNGTQVPTAPPLVGQTLDTTVVGNGVYIRVGTDSYLSADIGGAAGAAGLGNRISGNVHTDLYIESFDAYNVVTKAAFIPPASTNAASLTTLSTVFLDDTAQIDMRFNNNTGNSITIVSPTANFGGNLPGNVTANGAFYPFEAVLDSRFGGLAGNSGEPRLVQLFQIDGSTNLDSNNSFVGVTGVPQDIQAAFENASWGVTNTTTFTQNNPLFPQTFFQDQGNPFLP